MGLGVWGVGFAVVGLRALGVSGLMLWVFPNPLSPYGLLSQGVRTQHGSQNPRP